MMLQNLATTRRQFIALSAQLAVSVSFAATPALQNIHTTEDKFEGITWYRDSSTPRTNRANNVHAYIGREDRRVWLRYKLQYKSDSWLFIQKAVIIADGQRFEVSGRFERDNDSGIWEWLDVVESNELTRMFKAIAASKSAVVRYEGRQYHDDRTISAAEKRAILNIHATYIKLGGILPK